MLHLAAQNGNEEIFRFLVNSQVHCLQVPNEKEVFMKWLRQRNAEFLTCLHYCSFNGLVQGIKLLMDLEVPFETNPDGLGPVHYAAQGDCILSLMFFRDNKVSLENVDEKGGTPLHWACNSGNEQAVFFLTAWGVSINSRDAEGYTPLHLAVLAGNGKCVKRLLKKGANRSAKDIEGKTPLDHALENKFHLISDMLVSFYSSSLADLRLSLA